MIFYDKFLTISYFTYKGDVNIKYSVRPWFVKSFVTLNTTETSFSFFFVLNFPGRDGRLIALALIGRRNVNIKQEKLYFKKTVYRRIIL